MMRALLLLTLALALALSTRAAADEHVNCAHFHVGGFFGTTYDVTMREERILYRWAAGGPQNGQWLTFTLTAQQRRDFVAELQRLGVPAWKAEYRPPGPGVADGTQWSIAIDYDGVKVSSVGSNAYPDSYAGFTKAVSALVGGKPFQ